LDVLRLVSIRHNSTIIFDLSARLQPVQNRSKPVAVVVATNSNFNNWLQLQLLQKMVKNRTQLDLKTLAAADMKFLIFFYFLKWRQATRQNPSNCFAIAIQQAKQG
jgi:hypothetical protein